MLLARFPWRFLREETWLKKIEERRSSNEEISLGDACRMSIRGSRIGSSSSG
jgi:hypothetical protein